MLMRYSNYNCDDDGRPRRTYIDAGVKYYAFRALYGDNYIEALANRQFFTSKKALIEWYENLTNQSLAGRKVIIADAGYDGRIQWLDASVAIERKGEPDVFTIIGMIDTKFADSDVDYRTEIHPSLMPKSQNGTLITRFVDKARQVVLGISRRDGK